MWVQHQEAQWLSEQVSSSSKAISEAEVTFGSPSIFVFLPNFQNSGERKKILQVP
jgi:hypothetical protein